MYASQGIYWEEYIYIFYKYYGWSKLGSQGIYWEEYIYIYIL